MHTVNIHEAKTHFSRLLEEVSKGKEIVIAKSGKRMARLLGVTPVKPVRKPSFLKGKIKIAENFVRRCQKISLTPSRGNPDAPAARYTHLFVVSRRLAQISQICFISNRNG